MSIARPQAWFDRSSGSPDGQTPSAVAAGAAERVAAGVGDVVAVGGDLVQEALEERLRLDVGLEGLRCQTTDLDVVGGDVGRLPIVQRRGTMVGVAVPRPPLTDAGFGRRTPADLGRVVVEHHQAVGDVAGLGLVDGAARWGHRQLPWRVIERLGHGWSAEAQHDARRKE